VVFTGVQKYSGRVHPYKINHWLSQYWVPWLLPCLKTICIAFYNVAHLHLIFYRISKKCLMISTNLHFSSNIKCSSTVCTVDQTRSGNRGSCRRDIVRRGIFGMTGTAKRSRVIFKRECFSLTTITCALCNLLSQNLSWPIAFIRYLLAAPTLHVLSDVTRGLSLNQ